VAAIEPVMRACGGVWIAHGSGSADRDVVDANDRIRVPPASPAYTLRRVWLSEREEEGYYFGFSNEALWPLCHIAFVRPAFRESDWNDYRSVNARFAAAVVEEAKRPDPIILVQDYHFALLPKMIRERLPDATIVTFWHTPWPKCRNLRHLSLEGRNHRGTARQFSSWLPYAIPLQQFYRRPSIVLSRAELIASSLR